MRPQRGTPTWSNRVADLSQLCSRRPECGPGLAEGIAEAGHDVWWDRHLHGGARFATEIDRALKDAEAVVVIWSQASLDSAWVQDEAGEGRDSGRLVPVAIGSAKPPLGFRQFHTIDLGSWTGRGRPAALDELVEAIERTCGSELQ
jgi:adenylate cyclase